MNVLSLLHVLTENDMICITTLNAENTTTFNETQRAHWLMLNSSRRKQKSINYIILIYFLQFIIKYKHKLTTIYINIKENISWLLVAVFATQNTVGFSK